MDQIDNIEVVSSNIYPLPLRNISSKKPQPKITPVTPITDEMEKESQELNKLSKYQSEFDWSPIRSLELRSQKNPVRGGIVFRSPFRLVNAYTTCQQCLYSFEVDTYGRGCVHNCLYCYAKAELTQFNWWNNPYPVPVDLNEVRKVFFTVFETNKPHKWREILEKRIPIRIGSMSDSFMWVDDKLKVTKEFLKILNYYQYPYVIFTRSDLIAQDDYLKLVDKNLAAIQFSISSVNDKMNKIIEPGAPSAKRRLDALKKISTEGHWTTVRINPLFPIHPDGYFSDPEFQWEGEVPKFDFFSFDMIDKLAEANVSSVLAGFARFSPHALNQIAKATGMNLRIMYKDEFSKSKRDFHFSDKETRYYYEEIKRRCNKNKIEFTTCYIGNGESHFWKDQDLWSNKKDCCNLKNRIKSFKTDSREIPFEDRLKHVKGHKDLKPVAPELLHKELGQHKPIELLPESTI
jgi:DNA repair photolyase